MDPPHKHPNHVGTLYCPNKTCVASGYQMVGLQKPLLEFPVDPNHVRLACPFCDLNVTQCDGCASLIEDCMDSNSTSPFCTCRKCGFPNIMDENLRVDALGFPRNRPLPYHTARIIQRVINSELYRAYKKQELASIESLTSETRPDHVIVTSFASSAPLSLPTGPNAAQGIFPTTKDSPTTETNLQANGKKGESKKRARGEQLSKDELEAGAPSPKKRKVTLENGSSGSSGESSHASKGNGKARVLELADWKRYLVVPIASMPQFLRAQVRSIEVKKCLEHDIATWQSMQYPSRATSFLPVHSTLLQAIFAYPPGLQESSAQNNNEANFHHHTSNGEPSTTNATGQAPSAVFFRYVAQFLDEIPQLLTLKSQMLQSTEPVPRILAGYNEVASTAQQSNSLQHRVPDATLSSIVSIFGARTQHIQSLQKRPSMGHMNVLQMTGQEIRRRVLLLATLMRAPSAPSPTDLPSPQHATTPSFILPLTNVCDPSQHGRANTIEQIKMCILLLCNLYRSVAAAIL